MSLLALVSFAFGADPVRAPAVSDSVGQLMVTMVGLPSDGCSLSIDGAPQGKLPMRIGAVTAGSHAFSVECADGRTESWTKEVATAAGKLAMLEIGPLTAPPPVVTVTTPVETYVLLSKILGEKVKIDGGDPVTLPYLARLVPGPHEFVVLNPDGSERKRVTKDVVAVDGKAVVKLD